MTSTSEKYYHFGNDVLFNSIDERDRNYIFARDAFKTLSNKGFFSGSSLVNFKEEIDNFYQLAKGSLDLPFCLSAIAHCIGIKLLHRYGSDFQNAKYLAAMEKGEMIAAITNAEKGSGTDVMSMQASVIINEFNQAESISFNKLGSNIGEADLIFISAYKWHSAKKTVGIFIINKDQAKQLSHTEQLLGFHTGLTGEVVPNEDIVLDLQQQLGNDKAGLLILNDCFNLERLYISAIIAGMLDRLIQFAMEHIESKTTFGRKLSDNQYIQDKILNMYSVKTTLMGILYHIIDRIDCVRDLKNVAKELAVLKIKISDEALSAVIAFFEVFGYRSYTRHHIAHKLIKDLLAFKFLGGSKEQQKILLFKNIQKMYI